MTHGDFFIFTADQETIRIDRYLSDYCKSHSRTQLQKMIESGYVLVNGLSCKKRQCLHVGDEIQINFPPPNKPLLQPEAIPLDIIYEDASIVIINKPAGLVVHPGAGNPHGTLANGLLHHLNLSSTQELRSGIVHRLDKETSGIIITAKTLSAHATLCDAFSQRTVKKHYLAICQGKPSGQLADFPIRRDHKDRKKMAVHIEGKKAVTTVETLDISSHYSLVKASPITGRTHQIRLHLKELGSPIVGDSVYGSEKLKKSLEIPRVFLHAHTISFPHPKTGIIMTFQAPIPEDMQSFIKKHFPSIENLF
jgi:23S rRNA pseudouridine1911/1915/1917 synthase